VAHGRKRLATALSGLVLAATVGAVGLVPATPAQAEPDIDDVQQRVDTLFHEAEQASERLNDAKLELADLRRDLLSLQADQARQDTRLAGAREDLQDSIVSQYEGQHLSALGAVAVSDDAGSFVSSLSTMSAYNDLQTQLFDSFKTEAKALDLRSKATEHRADEVQEKQDQLAAEKKTIDSKLAEAQELLDRLEAEEREALLSRGSVRLPSGVDASGRAAAAIQYAMAQVGKAYVYGAAGPNAFDCSGLTSYVYRVATRKRLPHSSSAQQGRTRRISAAAARPGDLVFFHGRGGVYHVAIYAGRHTVIHAPYSGQRVKRERIWTSAVTYGRVV